MNTRIRATGRPSSSCLPSNACLLSTQHTQSKSRTPPPPRLDAHGIITVVVSCTHLVRSPSSCARIPAPTAAANSSAAPARSDADPDSRHHALSRRRNPHGAPTNARGDLCSHRTGPCWFEELGAPINSSDAGWKPSVLVGTKSVRSDDRHGRGLAARRSFLGPVSLMFLCTCLAASPCGAARSMDATCGIERLASSIMIDNSVVKGSQYY